MKLPLELWQSGYHKDEELEADREGMFLAVRAGYSPYGELQLFQRLAKLHNEYIIRAETPEEELSELAMESLSGSFARIRFLQRGSRKPSKSSLSSTGKIRRKPGLSGWNMKFTTASL